MFTNMNCGNCGNWVDFGSDQDIGQCKANGPGLFAMFREAQTITPQSLQGSVIVYEYPQSPRQGLCGQHSSQPRLFD